MRLAHIGSFSVLALFVLGGCSKSERAPSASSADPTVARLHWLGKKQMAAETNAAKLIRIWAEPQSDELEAQTLDRLALAPWRLWLGNTNATAANTPARLLRPLLDDLVQQEFYAEVRQGVPDQRAEFTLAIRLDAQRGALWQANLSTVLESLTGTKPVVSTTGLQVEVTNLPLYLASSPSAIRLVHSGGWTLFSLGAEGGLLAEIQARISKNGAPFSRSATNFWVEAEADLQRLPSIFGVKADSVKGWPSVSLTVVGDGQSVITRGKLVFPQSLDLQLEPWCIPTNSVEAPLCSFSAMRSVAPLLRKVQPFSSLPPEAVPDQMYAWDPQAALFSVFFAFPTKDATLLFSQVAPVIMNKLNPPMVRGYGPIVMETNSPTLTWARLTHASPFLTAVTNSKPQYLLGGFAPLGARPNRLMPLEIADHIVQGTNLVYFDWEVTGDRLLHDRYLDDVYRIAFDRNGPCLTATASLAWIGANYTNLSHSATEVRLSKSNSLTFARRSTVGLTAIELDLLANWIENPEFPAGLTSCMATNSALPVQQRLRSAHQGAR